MYVMETVMNMLNFTKQLKLILLDINYVFDKNSKTAKSTFTNNIAWTVITLTSYFLLHSFSDLHFLYIEMPK